jgi:hypothetical protein
MAGRGAGRITGEQHAGFFESSRITDPVTEEVWLGKKDLQEETISFHVFLVDGSSRIYIGAP